MAAGADPCLVDVTDGSLQLDRAALAEILCRPEIEDKPLAVVGIAGATRTGKSFVLSFLKRYLQNRGWKDSDWIGNEDTCAENGIKWRGGRHPDTKGILIWNEVFLVEKDNGEELAVLLVDTQGLFDGTMTREQNTKLFTLSVLLCSRLILNVKSRIDDRELEYLQFFTEYAKTAMEKFDSRISPFQGLIFLVRDWQFPYDDSYGLEGGKSYLAEVLEATGNEELNVVRRDLSSAFAEIQCFLMPHPGEKIKEPDFKGRNSDLDHEFLTFVQYLARAVFEPSTLKERVYDGRAMTGRQLWSLLDSCGREIKEGSVPEVKNMVEGFARMRNIIAVDEAVKIFVKKCAKNQGSCDTHDTYGKALDAALIYFEKNTRFGAENFRDEYRNRLILDCQDRFKLRTAWDECRKLEARNLSAQTVFEAWSNYKDAMKKEVGDKQQSDDELVELHRRHSDAALLKYRSVTANDIAFHDEHLKALEEYIQHSYAKFRTVNEERQMNETLGSQPDLKAEYEAYLLFHHIVQEYREEVEKFAAMYIEEAELTDQLERLQRSYLDVFEGNWDRNGPEIHPYRENLLSLFAREFRDGIKQNEKNKEVLDDIIQWCVVATDAKYQEKMYRLVDTSYCEPNDLKKAQEAVVRELTEHLEENVLGELEDSDKARVLSKVQENFDSKFEYFAEKNGGNQQQKPPANWNRMEEILKSATAHLATGAIALRKFNACFAYVKSKYDLVKPLLSAQVIPAGLRAAVPYLAIGTAAVVVTTIVAYCVYRRYQNRSAVQKNI